jgi:hypothetical protein
MAKLASEHRANRDLNISIQNVLDRCDTKSRFILHTELLNGATKQKEMQQFFV